MDESTRRPVRAPAARRSEAPNAAARTAPGDARRMPVDTLVIVAGGQTGVDRGAHKGARAMGVTGAGWCPAGRRAEDGVIPEWYPVQALPGAGPLQSTLKNVLDSDATALIGFGALAPGTVRVVEFCRKYRKPLIILDGEAMGATDAGEAVAAFVIQHGVARLNVTGPSARREPRGHDYAHAMVSALIQSLQTGTPAQT